MAREVVTTTRLWTGDTHETRWEWPSTKVPAKRAERYYRSLRPHAKKAVQKLRQAGMSFADAVAMYAEWMDYGSGVLGDGVAELKQLLESDPRRFDARAMLLDFQAALIDQLVHGAFDVRVSAP